MPLVMLRLNNSKKSNEPCAGHRLHDASDQGAPLQQSIQNLRLVHLSMLAFQAMHHWPGQSVQLPVFLFQLS